MDEHLCIQSNVIAKKEKLHGIVTSSGDDHWTQIVWKPLTTSTAKAKKIGAISPETAYSAVSHPTEIRIFNPDSFPRNLAGYENNYSNRDAVEPDISGSRYARGEPFQIPLRRFINNMTTDASHQNKILSFRKFLRCIGIIVLTALIFSMLIESGVLAAEIVQDPSLDTTANKLRIFLLVFLFILTLISFFILCNPKKWLMWVKGAIRLPWTREGHEVELGGLHEPEDNLHQETEEDTCTSVS